MTRTRLYRASLFTGLLAGAAGLIGCSSSSSNASWEGLSPAERAAAEAGIDMVERVYNREPVKAAGSVHSEAAELEFFVAVEPSDPIIGLVRSAIDEPASESDTFRWIPMVDATTFREVGRSVPSPKINLPPYESKSSGLVVSRYLNTYYLLVHNTGSKRVGEAFSPGFAVTSAEVSFDQFTRPTVDFTLNQPGRDALLRVTAEHKGSAIAAVVDGWVVCAPRVTGPVSSGSLSTGVMTFTQAEELAMRLNAGAEPDLPGQNGVTLSSVPTEDE
jgi:hypothetical protein